MKNNMSNIKNNTEIINVMIADAKNTNRLSNCIREKTKQINEPCNKYLSFGPCDDNSNIY